MHKFDTKFFLSVAQIRSIIIPVSTSFKKAIEVMDNGGLQVVLVTDEFSKIIGLVTDGDLRRAVLGGVKLSDSVEVVVKKDFCSVCSDDLKNDISTDKLRLFTHIPVLSDDREIVGLLVEKHMRFQPESNIQKNDTPVIIMAGGVGGWPPSPKFYLNRCFQLVKRQLSNEFWVLSKARASGIL